MKLGRLFLIAALLVASFSLFNSVYAQSTQYAVKLSAYSLLVTCPAEVIPGETVTFNVQGNPTVNGVYLQSLTATIYYTDQTGIRQLQTESLVVSSSPNAYNNYVSYGYYGPFNKNFTVNVPDNATATPLVSIFSESVMPKYQGWNPYSPSYPYYQSHFNIPTSYPYYAYYPYYLSYPYLPAYPYSYPPNPSYAYPQYPPSYSSTSGYGSDQAVASLSYVKASMPESSTVQSENQMIQQQLNQTQAANQELQARLSQQNSTIIQLTQQVTAVSGTVQMYQWMTFTFALLAVVILAFTIKQRRNKQASS